MEDGLFPEETAIATRGLSRRFGDRLAVDRLDLRVLPRRVYGLVGPGGAGKTTTVRLLPGLIRPAEVVLGVGPPDAALRLLRQAGLAPRPAPQGRLVVPTASEADAAHATAVLVEAGLAVHHVSLETPPLESTLRVLLEQAAGRNAV